MNNKILGRPIRSKNTFQKGKILGVNDTYVIVTFVKEEVPIPLKFEVFLENCLCEEEVKLEIEELKRKRDKRDVSEGTYGEQQTVHSM